MAVPTIPAGADGYDTPLESATVANVYTHTIPAGWSVGDLVIWFVNSGIRTVTVEPSGWTKLISTTEPSNNIYNVYHRTLESGDAGADASLTVNASTTGISSMLRIQGHDAASPMGSSVVSNGLDSGSDPTVCPDITTTVNDCLVIRFLLRRAATPIAVAGDTGTWVYDENRTFRGSVWQSSLATAGNTGTASWNTGASSVSTLAIGFAIAPTSGGGPSFPSGSIGLMGCGF